MDLAPNIFQALASIIQEETGIFLGPEKAYLVQHRLEPLIRSEALGGFEVLVNRLRMRTGSTLRSAVIDAITVKETSFFRDQACFNGLMEQVLPSCALKADNAAHACPHVRIWSAAAATGQEAYSLAMLVHEFAANNLAGPREHQFSILASDISAGAIETAKSGRYTNAEVHRGLSKARLNLHAHQRGSWWHINEPLQRLVQFRTFNLLGSFTELGMFDLILCRNVLIYFDETIRRKICRALYSALKPGGWLVLGSAESLHGMQDRFEIFVHANSILYRKPNRTD